MNSDVAVILSIGPAEQLSHIEEAIDSLRKQDYRDGKITIYCFIDGNRDEKINFYLGEQSAFDDFNLIFSFENMGLAHALNTLIDVVLAKDGAEYVARMDADDISLPCRISRQIAFLEANKEICVLGSWLYEFSEGSNEDYLKRMETNPKKLRRKLFWRCPLNHPTVMFRRRVFEKGYRYRSDLIVSQDYDLWIRMSLDGLLLANIPVPLLRFRRQSNFFLKRGAAKAWLEFKYKMLHLVTRRPYDIAGYAMTFARLFLGYLPPSIIGSIYRLSRVKVKP